MKTTLFALALLVAACSSPEQKPAPKAEVAPNMPELSTDLNGRSLRISRMVSSGGFALQLVDVKRDGDITVVRLKLTSPAPGSTNTMAFETHNVDVQLPSDDGTIHIRLQQVTRSVKYEEEPEFALAKIVDA